MGICGRRKPTRNEFATFCSLNRMDPKNNRETGFLIGWVIVALVALSGAVGHAFGRFGYGVIYPALRDDLVITNTIAGFIGSANVAAYLVGTLIVAWVTSRLRLLTVMKAGLVMATLGLLLASIASEPSLLAAGLILAGLGGAFLWIPAPVIAADALPENKRHLAVGLLGSGIGLGIVFVSTLSGWLRDIEGDSAWSTIYSIKCSIALILLVLFILIVRHRQESPKTGGRFGGFDSLTKMTGWKPLIIAYSIFGFMYLLVLGYFTTRLEDDSSWATSESALAFTLMGIAMIFGAPFFTSISKRFGVRNTLALCFAMWPVVITIVLTGVYVPVLVASILLGFLFSALPILITLYVVENTSAEDYGPAFSAATLAFGVAQVISPPIGGFIADGSGSFLEVFILSGGMSIMGLFAALRLPRSK